MSILVTGKVWKFGDNISSDYIAPGFAVDKSWDERKKHILHIHQGFAEGFHPGDVVVARNNFGCGSAREEAPGALKKLGIGCVVAESFGRIFFRNSIAIGIPIFACRGVSEIFNEGDILELDLENALVKNQTSGKVLKGPPLDKNLINIIKTGGIIALLKRGFLESNVDDKRQS